MSEKIQVEVFSRMMKERLEGNDFKELGGVVGIMEKLGTSTNGITEDSIKSRIDLFVVFRNEEFLILDMVRISFRSRK
jgi:hypothetical protein